jgi:hypothetical protein
MLKNNIQKNDIKALIQKNDIKALISAINNPEINIVFENINFIRYASVLGRNHIVEILLNDKRIDPSDDFNAALRLSSEFGHTKIVKLLLNDERVDPSDYRNYAIKNAFKNNFIDIVGMLWKNNKIKDSLKINDSGFYNKIIKNKVEEF